ncbi:MAG TPA: tetratricopeptide repeat protein, partial [Bryobacteraceae bacterium]|nr:tetratricopeptide repeat protein [Bryobacteraceae bacterium]
MPGRLLVGVLFLAVTSLAQGPEAQLAQAVELHQSGDLEGAIRAYRAVLQEQPENMVARSNLGAVYARQGRYHEAIEQYAQALTVDSENPGIRFNLGLAYYDSSDTARAGAEFAKVLGRQPDNERAAVLLADCELRAGDNRKVIALLSPLESSHQDDRALIYLLGTALIRDNQPEKGQKLVDRILRNGESAEAHVMLGTARMTGQDYKNAGTEFARAIELDPKLPLAHRLYGRVLLVEGDMARAKEAFLAELAVNPNDYDSNLMAAVLLKQEKQYEAAFPYLKR